METENGMETDENEDGFDSEMESDDWEDDREEQCCFEPSDSDNEQQHSCMYD